MHGQRGGMGRKFRTGKLTLSTSVTPKFLSFNRSTILIMPEKCNMLKYIWKYINFINFSVDTFFNRKSDLHLRALYSGIHFRF